MNTTSQKDKPLKLDDLYFGVMLHDFNSGKLKKHNLFASTRVRWGVARWVEMTPEERAIVSTPLMFVFGDTMGRCEYEFLVAPWPFKDADLTPLEDQLVKVDTYQMYVEPNGDYLMSLVDKVSATDAKKYLRAERKKYRRAKA